jgi:hypothetical protein
VVNFRPRQQYTATWRNGGSDVWMTIDILSGAKLRACRAIVTDKIEQCCFFFDAGYLYDVRGAVQNAWYLGPKSRTLVIIGTMGPWPRLTSNQSWANNAVRKRRFALCTALCNPAGIKHIPEPRAYPQHHIMRSCEKLMLITPTPAISIILRRLTERLECDDVVAYAFGSYCLQLKNQIRCNNRIDTLYD